MTNAETFAAICADFPFSADALDAIQVRLDNLLRTVQSRSRDGTISEMDQKRLQLLVWTMRDLVKAMRVIEQDGNPDDLIPF